jgi:hypothetical protein
MPTGSIASPIVTDFNLPIPPEHRAVRRVVCRDVLDLFAERMSSGNLWVTMQEATAYARIQPGTTTGRGVSRGASNFGNERLRSVTPDRSHPLGAAQWQPVTSYGNQGRETYKQEVPGSSPGPPTPRTACTGAGCGHGRLPLSPL